MPYKNYTDEDVKVAFESSNCIAEILEKLDLKAAGGNYATIKRKFLKLGLDYTSLSLNGRSWSAGKKLGYKQPIEYYLVKGRPTTSHNLRLRLISEGLKEHRCESCGLTEWLGDPIPLELDHIDGDHDNNLIDNLQILCPNCHAKTDTYRGKNIGKQAGVVESGLHTPLKRERAPHKAHARSNRVTRTINYCKCGKQIENRVRHCQACEYLDRKGRPNPSHISKITWPTIEALVAKLKSSNYSNLAKDLGVSDNAIRKHLRSNGVDPKTLYMVE